MTYQQLGYPWSIQRGWQLIYLTFLDHINDPIDSRVPRITGTLDHLIFIIASDSFHLNPYDNKAQRSGVYSSKTIYTQGTIWQVTQRTNIQRTNLDEFQDYWIDGGAAVQEDPTALTIDFDLSYVLRSTQMSKSIWAQEGNFPKCF